MLVWRMLQFMDYQIALPIQLVSLLLCFQIFGRPICKDEMDEHVFRFIVSHFFSLILTTPVVVVPHQFCFHGYYLGVPFITGRQEAVGYLI